MLPCSFQMTWFLAERGLDRNYIFHFYQIFILKMYFISFLGNALKYSELAFVYSRKFISDIF